MNDKEIKDAIREIGLALSASHGTIAIDDPSAEPTEISWRVDNSKEVLMLNDLEKHLFGSGAGRG